jgi:hypothetical protein
VPTRLPDGKVPRAGGLYGQEKSSDSAELYDPDARDFAPAGSMTVSRATHLAVLLDDGRVMVMGGEGGSGGSLASAEVYSEQ